MKRDRIPILFLLFIVGAVLSLVVGIAETRADLDRLQERERALESRVLRLEDEADAMEKKVRSVREDPWIIAHLVNEMDAEGGD